MQGYTIHIKFHKIYCNCLKSSNKFYEKQILETPSNDIQETIAAFSYLVENINNKGLVKYKIHMTVPWMSPVSVWIGEVDWPGCMLWQ